MNDCVADLRNVNDSLLEEIKRLKKVEQATKDFIVSLKQHQGVKLSEISKLAKSIEYEHQ